ncbi:RNase H domain-containing protein [Trichonephila clavipes]|nr:RNase H domain-containing protein [Trichonephila clavipes]
MYTDGSKLGSDSSGSGIYISFRDQEIKIQRKNLDFYSVFRSKLIAILEGPNSIESLPQLCDIWIFSESRSAIQHLGNWHKIHFQWIPSRVDIAGNEIADSLAKAGAGETTTPATPLT